MIINDFISIACLLMMLFNPKHNGSGENSLYVYFFLNDEYDRMKTKIQIKFHLFAFLNTFGGNTTLLKSF